MAVKRSGHETKAFHGGGCFRKQVLVAATQPVLVLEFEPDFSRRSSFYDAGWADHAVLDLQGCLRVHADMLIWRAPTQAGQLTLAFKRGVATLDGGSTRRSSRQRYGDGLEDHAAET